MTKQTVENLGHMILAMQKQLDNNGFKEIKTLSNSYETLLGTLSLSHEDFHEHSLTNVIKKHKQLLEELNTELDHNQIPKMLINEEFIAVNNLTVTSAKLSKITTDINRKIFNLHERYNKNVAIFAVNKEDAKEYFDKNIMNNNIKTYCKNEVTYQINIVTDESNYLIGEYMDVYKGRRFDLAHIDSKLNIEDKNNIMSMLKYRSNYIMF